MFGQRRDRFPRLCCPPPLLILQTQSFSGPDGTNSPVPLTDAHYLSTFTPLSLPSHLLLSTSCVISVFATVFASLFDSFVWPDSLCMLSLLHLSSALPCIIVQNEQCCSAHFQLDALALTDGITTQGLLILRVFP